MAVKKLTEVVVRGAKPEAGKRQSLVWDNELRGLGLLVSASSKSFVIQAHSKRITLGQHPKLSVVAARKAFHKRMGQLAEAKAQGKQTVATLSQAIDDYVAYMIRQKRSDRSREDLRKVPNRLLKDWIDKPIDQITRRMVIQRHEKISDENGPYMANQVMRIVRMVYNRALAVNENLPGNPVDVLRLTKSWNPERRRQTAVKDLATWYTEVRKMPNPIRRILQLFILTTGLRRTDASTVQWTEIDFKAGTLHRPKPKGGEVRAFTIPLSRFTLASLRHLRRIVQKAEPGSPWAFPTRDRNGNLTHVQEVKEQAKSKRPGLPSPHRLRDTYTTIAHEAGVDFLTIQVLTNHRPPKGNVTAGYIDPQMPHLRSAQETITEAIVRRLGRR